MAKACGANGTESLGLVPETNAYRKNFISFREITTSYSSTFSAVHVRYIFVQQNQRKKISTMKKILLFASVALVALSSCQKDADKKQKIFKGEVKTFQQGKAWTWYEVDDKDQPVRIAIAIDDAAMNSLSTESGEGDHQHENSLSLNLNPKASQQTPFKHVMLDWNPAGHPPDFYLKPHFDFHYYTLTDIERKAIPAYEQAPDKFDNVPGTDYIPVNYINIPQGVPQMGKHWVDVTSSEFTPAGFNQTFIYGTYDGKVVFYEPMITEAFIKANPSFERSIPLPAKFQTAGWYPTKMRIAKQDGATNIIIENFIQKPAN